MHIYLYSCCRLKRIGISSLRSGLVKQSPVPVALCLTMARTMGSYSLVSRAGDGGYAPMMNITANGAANGVANGVANGGSLDKSKQQFPNDFDKAGTSGSPDDDDDKFEGILVIVFPVKNAGINDKLFETLDEGTIENPVELARKIFWWQQKTGNVDTTDEGFKKEFGDGAVNDAQYRSVVRSKFLWICQSCGYSVKEGPLSEREVVITEQFLSSDDTEYYVELSLKKDGEAMDRLTDRYSYPIPYNEKAYADCGDKDIQITKNANGSKVPAYTLSGDHHEEDHLEPYRNVDCIRLFSRHLSQWVNIDELVAQNVISDYFYPSEMPEKAELRKGWGSLARTYRLPPGGASEGVLTKVRDYFGEEIAFFYFGFGQIVRFLGPMAILSLCYIGFHVFDEKQGLEPSQSKGSNIFRVAFALVMIFGTTFWTARMSSQCARQSQQWGMDALSPITHIRMGYDENQTPLGTFVRRILSATCTGVFLVAILIANLLPRYWFGSAKFVSYLVLVIMLVMKTIWTALSKLLTNLENWRTQTQWDESFSKKMALVQVVNTLLPLIVAGFTTSILHMKCRTTEEWKGHELEPLLNVSMFRPLPWRFEQWYTNFTKGPELGPLTKCIGGCLPLDLDPDSEVFQACTHKPFPTAACNTVCNANLFSQMFLYYVSYLVLDLAFILIAILITCLQHRTSDLKQKREDVHGLEYHRHLLEYKLGGWAGSEIEDYIEVALLWAPVVCFAIVEPMSCFFAFATCLVLYRTMAWRLTHLTKRPYPKSSKGMGIWLQVLSAISYLGIATQMGTAIFLLHPMRTWHKSTKYILFLVSEHALAAVVIGCRPLFQETPKDVEMIEENSLKFRRSQHAATSQAKHHHHRAVDSLVDEIKDERILSPEEYDDSGDDE